MQHNTQLVRQVATLRTSELLLLLLELLLLLRCSAAASLPLKPLGASLSLLQESL
jgi:hypothetical protein